MNAPWKPGLGNRDPLAAFVCDDVTLDLLRSAAGGLGFAPEKCLKGGLRDAVQSLSVTASPAILVVDLSECADPLNEINGLAEVCEPGTVVIALGRVNDVRLYRQLVASGLHDYLPKPITSDQLTGALEQAKAIVMAPRQGEAEAAKTHISTAVIGTRGGVGASTVATSLGWLFSAEHKLPTALFDLDVHFGTAALSMDLEPGRGLIDAIASPSRIDGLFIERAMTRANDHLAILSAEAPINSPLSTDGAAFVRLEEEFRHSFDMTVIDLPRNMLINFPQLLADVDAVMLVTEMTLASARDAIRILAWLKSTAPEAQVTVVANRVHPGSSEVAKGDFEASIERRINYSIPFDQKAAANAARMGKTLAEAARGTKAGSTLRSMAEMIVNAAEDEGTIPAQAGEGGSLLDRLDLKALLGKAHRSVQGSAPAKAGAGR